MFIQAHIAIRTHLRNVLLFIAGMQIIPWQSDPKSKDWLLIRINLEFLIIRSVFLSRVSEFLLFGSPRTLDFFDKRRPTFFTDRFRHFFYQITACRRIPYFTYIGLHNNKIIGVHCIEFILRV